MSVYCTLFSQTFYGLLFCYLTITDVTLYLQIIDFQFPSCCTSQPKKLNRTITVNSSTNTPITKKITLARFACLCFKMAGSGLAPASEDVRSFTVLLSGSKDCVSLCLFTATELRSCNYREPGNRYLLEMTMNLLLCFVCLSFTGLGIIRILSRC